MSQESTAAKKLCTTSDKSTHSHTHNVWIVNIGTPNKSVNVASDGDAQQAHCTHKHSHRLKHVFDAWYKLKYKNHAHAHFLPTLHNSKYILVWCIVWHIYFDISLRWCFECAPVARAWVSVCLCNIGCLTCKHVCVWPTVACTHTQWR